MEDSENFLLSSYSYYVFIEVPGKTRMDIHPEIRKRILKGYGND
jgi:hypothetical protein